MDFNLKTIAIGGVIIIVALYGLSKLFHVKVGSTCPAVRKGSQILASMSDDTSSEQTSESSPDTSDNYL